MQVWGIFPPEWHLPQLVCLAFCTITKSHLAEILDAKVQNLICLPCCAVLHNIFQALCQGCCPVVQLSDALQSRAAGCPR
jgi:Vps53-like, N-terminal